MSPVWWAAWVPRRTGRRRLAISRGRPRCRRTLVQGGFAASVVPTIEVPDPPWVTLETARESLCSLFLREFERAASEGDGAKVTRFFKLFPLIGRGDVGLDVYGRYVCQGVAGTARAVLKEGAIPSAGRAARMASSTPTLFTRLFEHIAQIVEGHGEPGGETLREGKDGQGYREVANGS